MQRRHIDRRIKNLLAHMPATAWTDEEASQVLNTLARIVRERKPRGDVIVMRALPETCGQLSDELVI